MTDAARRSTGEQQPVVVERNGHVTWKWLAGILVAVILSGGATFAKVHTGLAKVEVEITGIKGQMTLERGMMERHDREIRENRDRIIKLEP